MNPDNIYIENESLLHQRNEDDLLIVENKINDLYVDKYLYYDKRL